MIIVKTTDFTGFSLLALTPDTTPTLQKFIDRYEAGFIYQILGVDLGKLFIADLVNGVPVTQRFIDIFNAMAFQEGLGGYYILWAYGLYPIYPEFYGWYNSNGIYNSLGMKAALVSMIYYKWIAERQIISSQSGATVPQSEVSQTQTPLEALRFGEVNWNGALDTICTIQYYCKVKYPDTYPEYNGVYIRPLYNSVM